MTMPSSAVLGGGSAQISGSQIDFWTAPGNRPSATVTLKDTVGIWIELSPDGRRAAVTAGPYSGGGPIVGEYRVYDTATGRLLQKFDGRQNSPLVFSSDGRYLAAETERHTVTIWDLDHAGHKVVLGEHSTGVTRLAFNPDATRIATLSGQGIAVFDARSASQLLILHESSGPYSLREFVAPAKLTVGVTTLAFSADGRQILQTIVGSDPKGTRVQIKTWDGSPVTKR